MKPLSLLQVLLPTISSGLLLGGFLLYFYLTMQYKSRLYRAITILSFTAFLFVFGNAMNVLWGGWLRNIFIGRQFHRIEQLAGAFFLFSFPNLIVYLLQLNKTWKKINFIISMVGLGIAITITVIAFVQPDMFISMTEHSEAFIKFNLASDYAEGREGILYIVRDILGGLIMIYGIICMIVDLIWHKKWKELLPNVIGILIAIYGATIDILFIHFHVYYDPLNRIVFSRFTLGLTVMVFILMSGIIKKLIHFNKEIERARQKYRILAEGTKDCIFSLNKDYYFINANNQTFKQLHLKSDTLNTTNFFDILYFKEDSKVFFKDFIREKLEGLKENKKPVRVKARLKSYFPTEPKTFDLSFEYLKQEDGDEIIVRATRIHEDTILKYIQAESGRYVIDNYLLTVEEISNRLVSYLPKFLNDEIIAEVRIGLREMLINAVEHGNLKIGYEEKTKALEKDNYFLFIRSRQNKPEYQNKKIVVEYSLSPSKVIYRITDQGDGFDFKKAYKKIKNNTEKMHPHGRGIMMAMNTFDKVTYNSTGTSVTLVKEFYK